MKKDEELIRVDLLDVLLDETNTASIYMYDDNGRQLQFEQVADNFNLSKWQSFRLGTMSCIAF